MFSEVFFYNNTQRIRMEQNKYIRKRLYLAFFLCGPIVWVIGAGIKLVKFLGWFIDRSSTWVKGDGFLNHDDKIKIEKYSCKLEKLIR